MDFRSLNIDASSAVRRKLRTALLLGLTLVVTGCRGDDLFFLRKQQTRPPTKVKVDAQWHTDDPADQRVEQIKRGEKPAPGGADRAPRADVEPAQTANDLVEQAWGGDPQFEPVVLSRTSSDERPQQTARNVSPDSTPVNPIRRRKAIARDAAPGAANSLASSTQDPSAAAPATPTPSAPVRVLVPGDADTLAIRLVGFGVDHHGRAVAMIDLGAGPVRVRPGDAFDVQLNGRMIPIRVATVADRAVRIESSEKGISQWVR